MTRHVMHSGESPAPRGLPDSRGQHVRACTAGRFRT